MTCLPQPPAHEVLGNHGLLVTVLRQSWTLRNEPDPRQRRWHRADVRAAVRGLRYNRKLEGAMENRGENRA